MRKLIIFIAVMLFSFVGFAQEAITINSGWNWLPYLLSEPMRIDYAFVELDPEVGDVVKSHLSGYAVYTENGWEGSLSELQVKQAYHYYSCKSTSVDFDFPDFALPTVTTAEISDILSTSAHCGGTVTVSGGKDVTAYGVCWSTQQEPTLSDGHSTDGEGLGSFVSTMTGLTPNTTYYVRAYATSDFGTAYGAARSFTTLALPTVTTATITDVTRNTASAGGQVTFDGNATVTARGVCWSISHNPTISNSHTVDGTGTGAFVSSITDLAPHATYYIRAYATNSIGTAYGEEMCITTLEADPEGYLEGAFTINANNQQICFSQGNLQYQASTNTWQFAANQWDVVGNDNANASSSYSGWIDLFGWGTSGFNHGANCYQPWDLSTQYSDYYAYGSYNKHLYDGTGQADWGYNRIANGGNELGQWRTLTREEWKYVLDTRSTTSGIRFAKAQVNNVNGIILVPDNWNTATFTLSNTNNSVGSSFNSNVITQNDWTSVLEPAGCVFLPAAGYRLGNEVSFVNIAGDYWSSSYFSDYAPYPYTEKSTNAFGVDFGDEGDVYSQSSERRTNGMAVRLVQTYGRFIPEVTTSQISNIKADAATGGGEVTADGNATVTARGLCWSTTQNPTISDAHSSDGAGVGVFVSTLSNLHPNTTYYVRAYATNSIGTAYGNEVSFTTPFPEGAVKGLFSINSNGTKCYFSQGNLQYIGSADTPYWKFADHQWEYLGNNGQMSADQNVDRDFFGWGTSGYNHGAGCYQPWNTSQNNDSYYAYGDWHNHLYSETGQADWGYNPISNGGNQENIWRTLTSNEWGYVMLSRSTTSGIRYAKATVNGVKGVIVVPDNWSTSIYSLNQTNVGDADFGSNNITESQWTNTLEAAGCVFLPAAGLRSGTNYVSYPTKGNYWSATNNGGPTGAYGMVMGDYVDLGNGYYRSNGMSVRLVYVND